MALIGGNGAWEPVLVPDKQWDNLQLWDIAKGNVIHRLFGHKGPVSSVAITKNGRFAVSSDFLNSAGIQTVILWDLVKGQAIRAFEFKDTLDERTENVGFSHDDKRMYSMGKIFQSWDVETGKLIQSTEKLGQNGRPFGLSPDKRFYFTHEFPDDGKDEMPYEPLNLWDMQTGKMVKVLEIPKNRRGFRVVFSPDGKRISVGGGSRDFLQIWDLETGKMTQELKLPKEITSRFRNS